MQEVSLFANHVDLASAALGGTVLAVTDDFFAGAERLIEPSEPVFEPHRYTERGKWMDGWESRRRRGGGHDRVVLELGAAGRVAGFDVDTRFFVGNHPPFASIEGVRAPRGTPLRELEALRWRTLLPEVPLRPGVRNLFGAEPGEAVSHLRLCIFPDGGVARLRVFGKVELGSAEPELDARSQEVVTPGLVDLGAVRNGGIAVTCSDARFGAMSQLLMPGRAKNMGEGWETRRGRPPDHRQDWLIVALAARGTLEVVEVDTNHYKGNFPERCALEALDRPGATPTELIASTWRPLLASQLLQANTRHFFARELTPHGPLTHVRLSIFPDGGVSRLRLWGKPDG